MPKLNELPEKYDITKDLTQLSEQITKRILVGVQSLAESNIKINQKHTNVLQQLNNRQYTNVDPSVDFNILTNSQIFN